MTDYLAVQPTSFVVEFSSVKKVLVQLKVSTRILVTAPMFNITISDKYCFLSAFRCNFFSWFYVNCWQNLPICINFSWRDKGSQINERTAYFVHDHDQTDRVYVPVTEQIDIFMIFRP